MTGPRTLRFRRDNGGYVVASAGSDYHDVVELGTVRRLSQDHQTLSPKWGATTLDGASVGTHYRTRAEAAEALRVSVERAAALDAMPTEDDDACPNCGQEVSSVGSVNLRADGRAEHGWDCVAEPVKTRDEVERERVERYTFDPAAAPEVGTVFDTYRGAAMVVADVTADGGVQVDYLDFPELGPYAIVAVGAFDDWLNAMLPTLAEEPPAYSPELSAEVYERTGLPTPEMGTALAAGIAKEAERLGYASTADYLWAPGRLSPSVLDRVEDARQRAVVEAVVMTPEDGRAHVEAAVVAAATRDPEDARALVDEGRDLAEERAVRAEADEEAAGERAHEDLRARLVAALRAQSATAVEQVQTLAGRVLSDATMRLVPDGFRLLMLDRAGHVAALAARAANAVEDDNGYDLDAVVVRLGASYLAEVGARTRDTSTAQFAVDRVTLCARQLIPESPVSV